MAARVRKQVYIEPYHEERLKELAAATGITEAALIRQALDLGLSRVRVNRDRSAWQRFRSHAEALIELGPMRGGRTWKREDLYDREIGRGRY